MPRSGQWMCLLFRLCKLQADRRTEAKSIKIELRTRKNGGSALSCQPAYESIVHSIVHWQQYRAAFCWVNTLLTLQKFTKIVMAERWIVFARQRSRVFRPKYAKLKCLVCHCVWWLSQKSARHVPAVRHTTYRNSHSHAMVFVQDEFFAFSFCRCRENWMKWLEIFERSERTYWSITKRSPFSRFWSGGRRRREHWAIMGNEWLLGSMPQAMAPNYYLFSTVCDRGGEICESQCPSFTIYKLCLLLRLRQHAQRTQCRYDFYYYYNHLSMHGTFAPMCCACI